MAEKMSWMKTGETAVITELIHTGSLRRRLMDIGFTAGTEVICMGRSPLGDPVAYRVKGAVIALRAEDASQILVKRMR